MATGMFDNYPQPEGYIPDNSHPSCCDDCHCEDVIVAGGTALHTFTLDFLYSELCDGFRAIYSSGLSTPVIVDSAELGGPFSIEEEDGKAHITITLSPDETALFDPSRDAYAQLRLTMKDGSTLYGEKNRLTVKGTLGL